MKKITLKNLKVLLVALISVFIISPDSSCNNDINTTKIIEELKKDSSNVKSQIGGVKSANTLKIKRAIMNYKQKNYVGCIQDLEEVYEKEPYNSVVSYYLALAYSNIGKTDKAKDFYTIAGLLDPYSIIGKYSQRGIVCIDDPNSCNPVKDETQFDKFVNSQLKIKPEIQADFDQKNLQIKHIKINSSINKSENNDLDQKKIKDRKTYISNESEPTDREIAQAVRTFQKLGINPFGNGVNTSNLNNNIYDKSQIAKMSQIQKQQAEMMQLNALMGNNNNNNNNNFMNMLPIFMQMGQNNPNAGFKPTPELIQTMMMSQMMPNLDFSGNK